MIPVNRLTNKQKAQLRDVFTLIDGESKDSIITKDDLIKVYKNLGLEVPNDDQLTEMVTVDGNQQGLNFVQFLNMMASQLIQLNDREMLYNALKVFSQESDVKDLIIDIDELKEACCSVQLGDIGTGDHRLPRSTFDRLVKGFVKEQSNGKRLFLASNWLDAYID